MLDAAYTWLAKMFAPYGDTMAASVPAALLAALGGVVRALRLGRCGMKAVAVAAVSSAFAGVLVHLMLDMTSMPMSLKAAMVGTSGYASGELLKILAVRVCRWTETAIPNGEAH
jgi:TctA family transporter